MNDEMPARKKGTKSAEWEKLLAHAAMLQSRIPNAILVGGTAAALHAGHRFSFDHDHVVAELEKSYDSATAALESMLGWRTKRRVKGKLVLGALDGVEAGLRNLRRSAPLETTVLDLGNGRRLKVPTIREMLRIKAFLVVERNATRDYLDVAALSHHLGFESSAEALEPMNELYADFAGEGGSMLASILTKLAAPDPFDLTDVDLSEYKGISPPWKDWASVSEQCLSLAAAILSGSH